MNMVGGGVEYVSDKGVNPSLEYETDEDEFLSTVDRSPVVVTLGPDVGLRKEPLKRKNTAKRNLSARRMDEVGYDLAYFNLWWSRMAIEGRREARETCKQEEKAIVETKIKKKYKNIKRNVRVEDKIKELDSARFETSVEPSQSQVNLRGGELLNGGSTSEGEGRGASVSFFSNAIHEQPLEQKKSNFELSDTDGKIRSRGNI